MPSTKTAPNPAPSSARRGFAVQAVDYSRTAIEWARDRVAEAGVEVSLTQQSALDLQIEAGSGTSDDEVYERRSLGGGLGYMAERLREIWSSGLQVRIIRQMDKTSPESGLFGETFLWALLAQNA